MLNNNNNYVTIMSINKSKVYNYVLIILANNGNSLNMGTSREPHILQF